MALVGEKGGDGFGGELAPLSRGLVDYLAPSPDRLRRVVKLRIDAGDLNRLERDRLTPKPETGGVALPQGG